ncbi:Pam17p KNAG_0C01150 [Huiozyma naganishii CBS 8797]|uniref:Presequence translocated-associated motor subunit PAM17 n=1 Tax=Huiozyma naganishii (strain ATCC MYA-139 / BCRC 22969 / CBS 8797 / KCTC 17520 / NBRC 10181 / NCYC 3082 / Yp74L-3) TaxID=1071383 RepID=J7RI63_HUIN7|nr:hypothetical protein KNAG_0C01150 [Kazachstania naganishii CBS 8797]CCK69228.1 hypothetical protein KNAG_0C01150 [Kazachstania naganishii CBS 8797]
MLSLCYKKSIAMAATPACSRILSGGLRWQSTSVQGKSVNATNGMPPVQGQLSWTDFFQLRKTQRTVNVGSSIFTALLGCNVSWMFLSNMEIDPTQMIMGFDPLVVISAGLVASGCLGYLFGPLFGTQLFKLSHRKYITEFNDKNKDFLKHVIDNRVDASSQSFSNPVPDYYGEKIGSVKEYRQWLRDCHAYARKAKEFL